MIAVIGALGAGVTLLHLWGTSRWSQVDDSGTHRAFHTAVTSLSTLMAALHLSAMTVGISLGAVALTLAALHGAVWALGGMRTTPVSQDATRPLRWLTVAGALLGVAITLEWTGQSLDDHLMIGNDAAHYHVPNAVNLFLGGGVFDLPPTPHLYPMAASTLASWFLVPTGTSLLVDLVPLVPGLLLAVALAACFEVLTGHSGRAWSPWLVVALMSTPLWRNASHFSADMFFAAAAVAFVAACFLAIDTLRVGRPPHRAFLSVAGSLGLLLGSKTTGAAVAALVGGPLFAVMVWQLWQSSHRVTMRPSHWGLAGVALVLLSGGVWLVRNWVMWGSPIAPAGLSLFSATDQDVSMALHASILGDITNNEAYDPLARLRHYLSVWVSPWFEWIWIALIVLLVDVAVAARRRGPMPRPLVWAIALLGLTGVAFGGLLVSAPWTSLEWTQGQSLRYALPWFAWWPLLSWAALFPRSWNWTAIPWLVWPAAIGLVSWSVIGYFQAERLGPVPPAPTLTMLVVSAAALLALRRPPQRVPLALIGLASVVFGVASADARTRPSPSMPWDQNAVDVYAMINDAERHTGRACETEGRQFLVLTRFDEPMALQDTLIRNRVYYVGRDAARTAQYAPPPSPCDYVITTRALNQTARGTAVLQTVSAGRPLYEVGTVEPFVILGVR